MKIYKRDIIRDVAIYTDGSCKGNPGYGGWGAVLKYPSGKITEICGGENNTTNNRMELLAAIKALDSLGKESWVVDLYTDSKYLQKGVSQWLDNWIKRGWKTSNNKLVKNQDLWKTLNHLRYKHSIVWCWVRGHDGHLLNERADNLANKGVMRSYEENNIHQK